MSAASDYYALLGVARDATEKDIKRAFRALAKECHPDVAGDDPAKTERFKSLRAAYEVLADPVKRAAYDRRLDRRANPSPFYGSHWKHAGKPADATSAARPSANDLDLEDIFNDFGGLDFGFGKKGASAPGARPGAGAPPPPPKPSGDGWYRQTTSRPAGRSRPEPGPAEGGRPPPAEPGDDVKLRVDVPAGVAMRGGLVTVNYPRRIRASDQRSLVSIDELHELRVPPGVREGETLRVERMGNAGPGGGPHGDLVATVHIVGPRPGQAAPGDAEGARGPRMRMPGHDEVVSEGEVDVLRFDVSVVEAILGGRVEVATPQGRVRVTVPPGTSSGTRLRLRGKGTAGHDGTPRDLYAEVRIVVPAEVDAESRDLIEKFGRLNPGS